MDQTPRRCPICGEPMDGPEHIEEHITGIKPRKKDLFDAIPDELKDIFGWEDTLDEFLGRFPKENSDK